MRSFAIWYDKQNPTKFEKCTQIQIHINLWAQNICGGKRNEVFIDFGLLIHDLSDVTKVNLYCPFKLVESRIQDLSRLMCSQKGLINSIFNEDYDGRSMGGLERYFRVDVPDSLKSHLKDTFIVYQLDENDFEIEDKGAGAIVSFSTKDILLPDSETRFNELNTVTRYYFRFRISTNTNELKFMFSQPKKLSPFQEAFITTQVIDFRINNLRSCDISISDTFAKGAHFDIRAIHYLILRNASDELIYHGKNISSRLLEENSSWKKYFDNLQSSIIAYHFKEVCKTEHDPSIGEFVNLTRFEYQSTNFLRMFGYTYLLIYFGVFASYIANFIFGAYPIIDEVRISIGIAMSIITFILLFLFFMKNSE